MSAWVKPNPIKSPNTWWAKKGWGHCDNEWRIKVPGRPNPLKQHKSPTLEDPTIPTKQSRS